MTPQIAFVKVFLFGVLFLSLLSLVYAAPASKPIKRKLKQLRIMRPDMAARAAAPEPMPALNVAFGARAPVPSKRATPSTHPRGNILNID
ncbi:hypothetical protein DL96DRAFT_1818369 [Flagelloscypha sp. PMI_526]|nr:hypothetical protein DL96DRAFT_1818369 [Flagelloscypha sp. PMI_526]